MGNSRGQASKVVHNQAGICRETGQTEVKFLLMLTYRVLTGIIDFKYQTYKILLSNDYVAITYCFVQFTYAERFAVIAYSFNYSKYAKGLPMHMLTSYNHQGLLCEPKNHIFKNFKWALYTVQVSR